jgi:Domain of unknown function (DUF4145)
MKCPHCFVTFDDRWNGGPIDTDAFAVWRIRWATCSACRQMTIVLLGESKEGARDSWTVWPRGVARPVPAEVPSSYAKDFSEACIILPDSTNASAALSRRCLQSLLVNEGGAKKRNLADQIEEIVKSGQLRPQLAENLHYVRKVGNLAAHETKNANTGEIVDATKEEAEWLVEVLEGLFENYFVEPARERKRREDFDIRMQTAKNQLATTQPGVSDPQRVTEEEPLGQGQSSQVDY